MILAVPDPEVVVPGLLEEWWNTISPSWILGAIVAVSVLLSAWLAAELWGLWRAGRGKLAFGVLGRVATILGVAAFFVVAKVGPLSLELLLGEVYLLLTFAVWRLLWLVSRALLGRGWRVWLAAGTQYLALYFVVLAGATFFLPEGRSYFVLWHQLVRAGAALSGALAIVGFMLLLLPRSLDLLERSSFVQFVAARHVRAGKSRSLTAISLLSIVGVAVSAFALCVVISVMTGFGEDLKTKILGNNAHIKVEGKAVGGFEGWRGTLDNIRTAPGVLAATPIAEGEAMASSRTNTAGVIVRGVDPESIGQVIDLERNIELGKFAWMSDPDTLADLPPETVIWMTPGGQQYLKGQPTKRSNADLPKEVQQALRRDDAYPGLVLGRELAKTLHVYVGEEVTLISPLGDLGPMGVMPRSRRFRVAAVFYSGMYEYDANFAYMKMETAQEFLDLGHRITAIDVKLERAEAAELIRPQVETAVERQDVRVRDWKEMNRQLFSALELEKLATFLILSITILVASFCIICTLLLMVTEKSKEIAILKALGASDRAILWVFMFEGIVIGSIGTIFGVTTGLAATLGLKHFGFRLDPEVYYVDRLPINVDPSDYLLVAVCALTITTIATIYPALAASSVRPVEGIRYE